MTLRFSEAALRDLDDIMVFIATHYPGSEAAFETRLRQSFARIERWPAGARAFPPREGVRVVPLIRYPYKIFYRANAGIIDILHIHHTARQDPS